MSDALLKGPTNEVLAFHLSGGEYGIDILKVQEIRGYEQPTRIASTPTFIKSVTNLRGVIVPIIDMRIFLAVGTPVYDAKTVVIIICICGRAIGMVVDSVSDVVTLKPENLRPAPYISGAMNTQYLTGLATIEDRMLILVNIEQRMSQADLGLFEQQAA